MSFRQRVKIDLALLNRTVLRLATVNLVADAASLIGWFGRHTMFNILHRTIMQDFPVRNLSTLSTSTNETKNYPIKIGFDSTAKLFWFLHRFAIHTGAGRRENQCGDGLAGRSRCKFDDTRLG